MHLTVVSPFPPTITGIGQYGYHITKAIEDSGVFSRITVLAGAKTKNGHSSAFHQAEIDYCWQPDQLKTRSIILSRLKRLKPDLVWLNLGASVFGKSPLANVAGMFIPMQIQQMGIPTVVTLHELVELADLRRLNAPGGLFAPAGARLLTELATRADHVCLTMQHYADWLSNRGVDCTHIPIGSYQSPEQIKENEQQELLFFTTLAPFKGLELLLQAFKELQREIPQITLSIAGAEHARFPGYAKDLKAQCAGATNIKWLGQVSEEKVKDLFKHAKIVVLPYLASTGSSSVLYQSATWGRAVVASNLSEHLHLANENNLKIEFFKNGNVQSLKETIRNLLNSPGQRMSQINHNFDSIKKLTPKETSEHYIQAFNHALEKCQSPKRINTSREEIRLRMIPRRVYFAILFAFLLHGLFILTARYHSSYDAYTHMLFADHYAKDWFSLWETRWYTGFDITSYPPLTHQLIALLIPLLGFEKAYAVILWLVTALFPLGIYTFSRIFTGKSAASYAALAAALMLPIFVTAHIFGQLPFLTATLFTLFSTASLARFLREGGVNNYLLAISITATTMAAHHATLLVQPFFIFAVVFFQFKKEDWKHISLRLLAYFISAIPAGIAVIWPFWQWGMHQQLQTPIDHLSRHNFLTDPFAAAIFFLPFYFPIGAIIPFLFYKWPRKFLGLQFSFTILFLLGLGGTTPLPSLFFGKSWEWLTYDRFAFWAVLTLTPFFGMVFIHFRHWIKKRFTLKPIPASLRGIFISTSIFTIFACAAIGSWFTPLIWPIQPAPIDMKPIVNWLEAKDHYYWRYLTFGFGDQFAYLNLLTDKTTTLDGSYHTARTIPELRESGIGQIDTAYWALKGTPAIVPILKVSGDYGVRWGFVNRKEFIPELQKSGWVYYETLENGIEIWENPKFTFQPPIIPPADPFESFSWGIFPMLSLVTTLTLGTVNIWPYSGEKFIRKIHGMVIGLLPLSLGFWYYKIVFEFKHQQVYFTYDHALFFLSDGLALVAIILWLAVQTARRSLPKFSPLSKILFALCLLVTVSSIWSADWRTSLYLGCHFGLIFLLILSLQDWHEAWRAASVGFAIALFFQVCIGITEFTTQSMQFLEPLNLHWPGLIDASSKGAGILKFQDGGNFLRIYGTFPHPNILAGFVLMCLAGTTALILGRDKINCIAWTAFVSGIALLAVTFSRSAWLGLFAFFFVLLLKSKPIDSKKIWLLAVTTIITFTLTLTPLRELFLSRTTTPTTIIEESSLTERIWLAQQAWTYAKENPWTGVGAGSFVIQLGKRTGEFNLVEPVHNVPLLALSELGIIGVVLLLTIVFVVVKELYATSKPNIILLGALLVGMGTIALFDHYFWSLAPGRMMLGLALGLWQGQIAKDGK